MGYEGQSLSKASTGEAGGFELCANPMGCAPKGGDREIDTHYKMKALSLNKIPPNTLHKGGHHMAAPYRQTSHLPPL